jgi:hypothetical protein
MKARKPQGYPLQANGGDQSDHALTTEALRLMDPLVIALLTFACSFGAALVGLMLHVKLPDHHLDGDSKDTVKLVMGLIATMAALVLGLLIASAQNSYNTRSGNVQKLSADVAQLDHLLAIYGPDANNARVLLKEGVSTVLERAWSPQGAEHRYSLEMRTSADRFFDALQNLVPGTEAQRIVQAQALQLLTTAGQTRSLILEQTSSSVSWPFLTILVFWISMLFVGFGLFTRFHATVVVALLIGSLSISAAIFLILELGDPHSRLIPLSDAPLRGVLTQIGQ